MDTENAIKLVNEQIKKETLVLEKCAKDDEQSPIMLEGETTKGYYCQMMVDPKEIAPIMLKYDYPIYHTLGEDAPSGMWTELATHFGLENVTSVDL